MVYFDHHAVVPPATEALVRYVTFVFAIIGIAISASIFFMALSLLLLSYVLWTRDHKQVNAHREHKRLDERKQA